MSSSKRARTAGQSNAAVSSGKKATTRTIMLTALVVVIIGAVAGFAIYRDRVAPFRTAVLVVDDTSITMRYFLKRLAMSGEQSLSMLQILTNEEILKKTVTKPPYNITASERDIDQFARDLARGEGETIDEREFREWYRQKLNETRLSDAEFRDLLKTTLLSNRMSEYLAEQLPSVAEQVFINVIMLKDYAVGTTIKKKYDAGEDFAVLARTYSADPTVKDSGGKIGWVPRGVLDAGLETVAFGLKVGQASDPFYIDEKTVVVVMISERVAAREIDEQSLRILKSRALDEWHRAEYAKHKVEIHGFKNGYDSETDSWVSWQLMRMQRGQKKSESDQ